jgi:hypothetical protein
MKHIIIEGCDRTSKSTLVGGLCKHFKFDNVTVRHFSKPPKNNQTLEWQLNAFISEGKLLNSIKANEMQNKYYENIVIWNRSPLGEIVWGPLYRKNDKEQTLLNLRVYEFEYLRTIDEYKNMFQTYLIYLYADAEFLTKLEDGNSFSNTAEQKQKELDLFEDAIDFSIIPNKMRIKVCDENLKFYTKELILNQVINFIK